MIFEPVTAVTIEEIAGDWSSLEPAWHQLWRELPNPTPFQTYAWNRATTMVLQEENPSLLVAHAPDRLVGILPIVGLETLRVAGGNVSDYQDALAAPGFERMFMNAIVEHLSELPHRWSECHFQNLRSDSALLYGNFGASHSDVIELENICPVLTLTGPSGLPTELPQVTPADQREKVRYCRRRAEKLGKIEFETASWENLPEFLSLLFNPQWTRQSLRGQIGPWDLESVRALHMAAAPGLFRNDVLRIYSMRLGGNIVAIYLGFLCGGRAYYYLSGFDPVFAEISPETLLIAHAIEEAIRESATEFDFLRGGESCNHAWGAHDSHTYCRRILRA